MKKYLDYRIEKDTLSSIDKSIKEARKLELGDCPYAVVINPNNASGINLDSLTYLPQNGFKSVPLIKSLNVKEDTIKLAYDEESLVKIIKFNNTL